MSSSTNKPKFLTSDLVHPYPTGHCWRNSSNSLLKRGFGMLELLFSDKVMLKYSCFEARLMCSLVVVCVGIGDIHHVYSCSLRVIL